MSAAALLLALLLLCATEAASQAEPPQTVEQVWAGYDPRALPLDMDLEREWVEQGVRFREFYFTAEVWEGEPARIFAYSAAPSGAKALPAVLHIHGGGQTASLDWLRFWTRRGYAAGTFDFCGPWGGRTKHTLWGRVPADMATAERRATGPDVRSSRWHHWTLAARRMITVLEQMPEADPDRIGIFGISIGGTLTWMVAGSDPRVKCAVPIYGNGWLSEQPYGRNPDRGEQAALLRRTLESQAYAPLIRCPVLYMSATNDFHGWMDNGYRTLALARGPTRQVFTLHFNHHIEPGEGRSLPLWMDAHLRRGASFPATPRLRVSLVDGIPRAALSPDHPNEVARVRIHYCLGEAAPQGRYWRLAAARRLATHWEADLPTPDPAVPLRCFANVYYRSGVALSSEMPRVVPAEMGEARATETRSPLIEDFADGFEGWFFGPAYTDPLDTWTYLRAGEGTAGAGGLTVNLDVWKDRPIHFEIATHKIGDPRWRGPDGAALAFWFRAGDPTALTVRVEERTWAIDRKSYEAEVRLRGAGSWQRIVLAPARFKTEAGEPLADWEHVDRLAFAGQSPPGQPPVLSRIEWLPHARRSPTPNSRRKGLAAGARNRPG